MSDAEMNDLFAPITRADVGSPPPLAELQRRRARRARHRAIAWAGAVSCVALFVAAGVVIDRRDASDQRAVDTGPGGTSLSVPPTPTSKGTGSVPTTATSTPTTNAELPACCPPAAGALGIAWIAPLDFSPDSAVVAPDGSTWLLGWSVVDGAISNEIRRVHIARLDASGNITWSLPVGLMDAGKSRGPLFALSSTGDTANVVWLGPTFEDRPSPLSWKTLVMTADGAAVRVWDLVGMIPEDSLVAPDSNGSIYALHRDEDSSSVTLSALVADRPEWSRWNTPIDSWPAGDSDLFSASVRSTELGIVVTSSAATRTPARMTLVARGGAVKWQVDVGSPNELPPTTSTHVVGATTQSVVAVTSPAFEKNGPAGPATVFTLDAATGAQTSAISFGNLVVSGGSVTASSSRFTGRTVHNGTIEEHVVEIDPSTRLSSQLVRAIDDPREVPSLQLAVGDAVVMFGTTSRDCRCPGAAWTAPTGQTIPPSTGFLMRLSSQADPATLPVR